MKQIITDDEFNPTRTEDTGASWGGDDDDTSDTQPLLPPPPTPPPEEPREWYEMKQLDPEQRGLPKRGPNTAQTSFTEGIPDAPKYGDLNLEEYKENEKKRTKEKIQAQYPNADFSKIPLRFVEGGIYFEIVKESEKRKGKVFMADFLLRSSLTILIVM